MLKTGANIFDLRKIAELQAEGHDAQTISAAVQIEEDVVRGFMDNPDPVTSGVASAPEGEPDQFPAVNADMKKDELLAVANRFAIHLEGAETKAQLVELIEARYEELAESEG